MQIIHDDYAQEDLIGREYSRDSLVSLISSVNLDARGSFTIGVYGEWGSGKTTMLRQIREEIDKVDSTISIWFNPWQFASDENIVLSFFQMLSYKLEEACQNKSESHGMSAETASKFALFANSIQQGAISLAYGVSFEVRIPFLARARFKGADWMKRKGRKKGPGDKLDDILEEKNAIYYDMIGHLKNSVDQLDVKIVVFVDDLDRCPPDQAVNLLDGLKVLLDIPNFVFVIGAAQDVIERAVQKRHGDIFDRDGPDDLGETISYLDKVIQFPFDLPLPDRTKVIQNLLNPNFGDLEDPTKYSETILNVIGTNLRSLKRFLNVVSFSRHSADLRFKEGEPHLELIIKSSLMAFALPRIQREFEKAPQHLVTMNRIVVELGEVPKQDLKEALRTGNKSIDELISNESALKLFAILKNDCAEKGYVSVEEAMRYIRLSRTSSKMISGEAAHKPPAPIKEYYPEKLAGRLREIDAKSFVLGNPEVGEVQVTTTRPLFSDMYPVTQDLYQQIMGMNPSHFVGKNLPVESVSWFEAVSFCNKLSKIYKLDPVYIIDDMDPTDVFIDYSMGGFRLPTEAEWEGMCVSGSLDESNVDDIAWYMANSDSEPQEVGHKAPNSNGLYDMLGNVWEWCNDWYETYPDEVTEDDPAGPPTGTAKVCRGGSWANFASFIHPEHRKSVDPRVRDNNIGFRIVTNSRL